MAKSVELSGRIKAETEDALLLDLGSGKSQHWLPLSHINRISRLKDGTARVAISEWLAKQIYGAADEDSSNSSDSDFGKPPEA